MSIEPINLVFEVTDLRMPIGAELTPAQEAVIHALIDLTPSEHRRPLTLRYLQGLEYRAIGEKMHVSHETARKRTHEAWQALRDNLHLYAQLVAIARQVIAETPTPGERECRPHTLSIRVTAEMYRRVVEYRDTCVDGTSLSAAGEALLAVGLAAHE